MTRLLAFASVIALFGIIFLYVREFDVFSNTVHAARLVWGALSFGLIISLVLVYVYRKRFLPWERHLPEVFMLIFGLTLIMPLIASLFNRSGGSTTFKKYIFLEEKAFAEARYGVLKDEDLRPTGYFLLVKDKQGNTHKFRYRKQQYYPLTKTGEEVLLPMRKGLLGFERMMLK